MQFTTNLYSTQPGVPEFFLPGGEKFKKRALFLLKRHCQQKQILVVMLQFEYFDWHDRISVCARQTGISEKFYFANLLFWLDQFFSQC